MRKLVRLAVTIVVLLVLAFPVANLVFKTSNQGALAALGSRDPGSVAAAAVLEEHCVSCHAPGANLPYYASLPVAGGLIRRDIEMGLRFMDLAAVVRETPVSEVALAKVEHTVEQGSMPPVRYKVAHWDGGLGAGGAATLQAWIDQVRLAHYATGTAVREFAGEVVQPLPAPEAIEPARAALGEKLYHDTRLSGDNTISCATCHGLDTGGCDRLQFSTGIGGAKGDINAPTVYNAVFCVRQFWDGRAADLKEQAGGPVTNPIEMGGNWPDVIAAVGKDQGYGEAFAALYPQGVTSDSIQDAIAAFEKTLVTNGSRFDQYLTGAADALAPAEVEGYRLFKEHGCATCHAGRALGGQSFELMGHRKDYFAQRGNVAKADNGRFNHTGQEEDRHKFKVPTLRNVALTDPYFHDGSTSDLKEAVEIMALYNSGEMLPDASIEKIAGFLATLTGQYKGRLLE